MKRLLTPSLNPAGLMAAAAAAWALYAGIRAHAVTAQVVVAALTAFASLLTRQAVTPVADPKDGAGRRLTPHSVITVTGNRLELSPAEWDALHKVLAAVPQELPLAGRPAPAQPPEGTPPGAVAH